MLLKLVGVEAGEITGLLAYFVGKRCSRASVTAVRG
jgi:hypothetical protein